MERDILTNTEVKTRAVYPSEREREYYYTTTMVSTTKWLVVSKEYSKRFCRKRVSHPLDANVDFFALIRSLLTFSQMAKHLPQLFHSRAAAVHDVRKPFLLQPLFTFLSSPASSAVRDYRSILFERLQNIHRVRTAQAFLRSLEWRAFGRFSQRLRSLRLEISRAYTPAEFIGRFDLKKSGFRFARGSEAFLRSRPRLVSSLLPRPRR